MKGLDALRGQPDVKAQLSRRLAEDSLPHALLLVGPAGSGKASTLIALAQRSLCEAATDGPARCGQCPGCRKIDADTHADLHTVPETGAIKTDMVRTATRRLQLRSAEGGRKLLVLPDAERMTAAAQNALLKTLEEPPAQTHILLSSSVPEALLLTVRSRCQTIRFAPLSSADAEAVLEDQGIEKSAATLLAGLGQGSLRFAQDPGPDALLVCRDEVRALDERLVPGHPTPAGGALDCAEQLAKDKDRLRLLLELWLIWLRDQLLCAVGGEGLALANRDTGDAIRALAEQRGFNGVQRRIRAVLAAHNALGDPRNRNPQMIVEKLALTLTGVPMPRAG